MSLDETISGGQAGHITDHEALHGSFNDVTHLPAATGVAATDTATWQAALDIANGTSGVHIVAGPGDYWINATLKAYDNTRIQGAGWDNGTLLSWHGSALGSRRSLLEAKNFSLTTTAANSGFTMSNVRINGRGLSTGGGITGWWEKAHLDRVWIEGFDGTSAGHGRCITLATDNAATGTSLAGGENIFITNSRFESQRERVYIEGGGGQYTDGVISDCEFLITPAGNGDGDGIADLYMKQSGGWLARGLHTNGSLGHGIYAESCAFLRINDCFLDGWGCGGTTSGEYGAIYIKGFSSFRGGTGGVIISNNGWKARGWQNTTEAPSASWAAIKIDPQTITFDATVTIEGNGGWMRPGDGSSQDGPNDATVGSGTAGNFAFQLEQSSTSPSRVTYVVTGNNPQWTFDGTPIHTGSTPNNSIPYSDASVFLAPGSSTWPRARGVFAGNSFQESTSNSVPAAGWWPKGMKRWNDPAASTSMGNACTASGTSGTWKAMPNYGA